MLQLSMEQDYTMHATTVLCVTKGKMTCMGSDGQISHGNTIIKNNVKKVRLLNNGQILAGFAGLTSDSLIILNYLESTLQQYPELERACIEMVKEWKQHVYNKGDSLILVSNGLKTFLISGAGDIILCDDPVVGIGSGGMYAAASAQALLKHTRLNAGEIVESSLQTASSMCIYTNNQITTHTLEV